MCEFGDLSTAPPKITNTRRSMSSLGRLFTYQQSLDMSHTAFTQQSVPVCARDFCPITQLHLNSQHGLQKGLSSHLNLIQLLPD